MCIFQGRQRGCLAPRRQQPWWLVCAAVFTIGAGTLFQPSAGAQTPDFRGGWAEGAAGRLDDSSLLDGVFDGRHPSGFERYVIGDFLVMQRDNQATNAPLVEDFNTGDVLLTVGDLQPASALGLRIFYGGRAFDDWGREVGYTGVFNMFGGESLVGSESNLLSLAGDLRNEIPLPYAEAENVNASYASNLNSVEYNVFRTFSPNERPQGRWLDLLGGLRWVNVSEAADLDFTCCIDEPNGPFRSSYDVSTTNNLLGGQLGGRWGRYGPRWGFEGWGKAGIFANIQGQQQAPIVDPTGGPGRPAQAASGVSTAMVADINLSVVYRLTSVWGLRVGYNLMWIEGLALAPNQWDFSTADGAGSGLDSAGGIFLNGANLGLEARW